MPTGTLRVEHQRIRLPKAQNQPASQKTKTEKIQVVGVSMVSLFGTEDRLLKALEQTYPQVEVHARGNEVVIKGPVDDVDKAKELIETMAALIANGQDLTPMDLRKSATMMESQLRPADVLSQSILSSKGKTIRPKTIGQKNYVDAIDESTIVFGIGPAGTGKTYLAMAKAVQALQRKEVSRIILTRPAVEAGERLGFLPGTLTDKIDPYLRPL
ncbi:MAG: PhoH family protein, partial [Actinobacteria bacterium]|nr:PhoH family protein [Actinomycetota bacterium]